MLAVHSSGREGFKNTRKGTNVAAQQTAVSFSEVCINFITVLSFDESTYKRFQVLTNTCIYEIYIFQTIRNKCLPMIRVRISGIGPGRMVNIL